MTDQTTYMMVGERLCLDFANTVSWHDSQEGRDWFTGYEKLVEWSWQAKILTKEQAHTLLQEAEHQPSKATEVLKNAVDLREAIFRIFGNIARDKALASQDLSILNSALSHAYQLMELKADGDAFSLTFQDREATLDGMIPPVIQSAVDLLTSEKELKRVKKCEGDPCGWLFLDTSRNRSRRWCSMEDCGNRAKARRFYQRKK